MGIQRSQEDSWTMEMRKYEHRPVLVNGTYIEPIPVEAGGKGGAPFQEYPKMLYQAEHADGGPRICGMDVVHNADQESVRHGQGWYATQQEAIDGIEARQLEMAKLAANRAFNERLMSGKARDEANAVDEATMQHLPEIPETPIKARGRQISTSA